MDKNFKNNLYKLLKKDSRLWDEEKKELNETLLKDLVDELDKQILSLLFGDREAKEKFFVKVKDVFVFKQNDFKFFIDENKLDNSYTQYANRIGLSVGNKFLSERDEVVLNWPFKDCVLEGGMTKEDAMDIYFVYDKKTGKWEEKKAKRKEIFFNEVLARDEIDRLEDPKAFCNWARFTEKGEEKVKGIKRDSDGVIRENFVIKGNNLLALHSLKKQFTGKIKLIYIDPPYNTGSDSFMYNDKFNHSSWLTFMKNRLEVAKEFLRDDGLIFVQIGHAEKLYLKILMDEIFGRDRFINEITWKKYSGVKNQASKKLTTQQETIFFYSKKENFNINMLYNPLTEDYVKNEYKYVDEKGRRYAKLRGRGYQNENKITKIKYLDENLGSPITTLWDESHLQINTSSSEKIKDFIGQKPEALLKRIIEITTSKQDIILDFHAGTGTSCAVAHKMGRQWIGIEQLNYSENNPEARMKGVIAGDQTGISKEMKWKSGGDFIYCQLAKWNEEAKEKIMEAKSLGELIKLFDELYERYFLNYNVRIKEFREKIIKEEEFKKLDLTKQKEMFCSMLDLNQMYVNFSEREDKKYKLSKEDIALSEQFYNQK